MMKLKYLICNHKNKLTYNEVKQYVNELDKIDITKVKFIICPSIVYIYNFVKYKLAAQDISAYEEVVTGDITAKQLKSLMIDYVIIGHSERRKYLNENQDILINKINNANKYDIKVIYCINSNEKNLDSVKQIIKNDLEVMKRYLKSDAIIAYEPEWAIGKEIELDYNYISEVINYIKCFVNNNVLYGGNVNDKNIEELSKIDKIDGFLISNSSLNVTCLQKIISKMT